MASYSAAVFEKILGNFSAEQLAIIIKNGDASPFDDEFIQDMTRPNLHKLVTELCEGSGALRWEAKTSVGATVKAQLTEALAAICDHQSLAAAVAEHSLRQVLAELPAEVVAAMLKALGIVQPPNNSKATEVELVVLNLTLEGLAKTLSFVPISDLAEMVVSILQFGPKQHPNYADWRMFGQTSSAEEQKVIQTYYGLAIAQGVEAITYKAGPKPGRDIIAAFLANPTEVFARHAAEPPKSTAAAKDAANASPMDLDEDATSEDKISKASVETNDVDQDARATSITESELRAQNMAALRKIASSRNIKFCRSKEDMLQAIVKWQAEYQQTHGQGASSAAASTSKKGVADANKENDMPAGKRRSVAAPKKAATTTTASARRRTVLGQVKTQ